MAFFRQQCMVLLACGVVAFYRQVAGEAIISPCIVQALNYIIQALLHC